MRASFGKFLSLPIIENIPFFNNLPRKSTWNFSRNFFRKFCIVRSSWNVPMVVFLKNFFQTIFWKFLQKFSGNFSILIRVVIRRNFFRKISRAFMQEFLLVSFTNTFKFFFIRNSSRITSEMFGILLMKFLQEFHQHFLYKKDHNNSVRNFPRFPPENFPEISPKTLGKIFEKFKMLFILKIKVEFLD